ncbi:hypothetical protein OG777_24190 [Micromonospora peucetia]|uniref:Uncharacterized protein n=2 Tax=Micromonospora peucetia TaxID=47871 RepID=A0ABZ1EGB4_9ACTN|nr:hypothetical protein [Micromonospora peucetia]MCX4390008.1 hypothetical protein [Micromonospora peucetia]WSA32688.1 hypothetical protein OIE14_00950 [Micromonospora peucetia]
MFTAMLVEQPRELVGAVLRNVVQHPAGLAIERPGRDLRVGADDLEVGCRHVLDAVDLVGRPVSGPQLQVTTVHQDELS